MISSCACSMLQLGHPGLDPSKGRQNLICNNLQILFCLQIKFTNRQTQTELNRSCQTPSQRSVLSLCSSCINGKQQPCLPHYYLCIWGQKARQKVTSIGYTHTLFDGI